MKNKVLNITSGVIFVLSFITLIIPEMYDYYKFCYYLSMIICFASLIALMYFKETRVVGRSKIEILNDYIIIEHIEVKASNTFHMTAQDQSKLVYKDALVKFTPKESRVKPGDMVIYNKAMAYPYLLDGKPHFIITEEYIVAIK